MPDESKIFLLSLLADDTHPQTASLRRAGGDVVFSNKGDPPSFPLEKLDPPNKIGRLLDRVNSPLLPEADGKFCYLFPFLLCLLLFSGLVNFLCSFPFNVTLREQKSCL